MDYIKNSNMTRLVIIDTMAIVIKKNSNRKYPQILLWNTISGNIRDPCLKDNTTVKSQHSNVFFFNTFQWPPAWMARPDTKINCSKVGLTASLAPACFFLSEKRPNRGVGGGGRDSRQLRLSEFVQISEFFFQIYITDIWQTSESFCQFEARKDWKRPFFQSKAGGRGGFGKRPDFFRFFRQTSRHS